MRAALRDRLSLVRLFPLWIFFAVAGCEAVDSLPMNAGTGGINETGTGGQSGGGQGTGGQGAGGQGAGGEMVSCGQAPPPPCSTGWVSNISRVCGYGGNGGITCGSSQGDGLCYKECTGNADCTDPCFPQCKQHFLFMSSDAGEPVFFCER